jgi:hypothetical protein
MAYGYADSLLELESELGQTFVWNSGTYPCIIGARNETKELGEGGFALQAGLELVVRLAALPNSTPPAPNDDLTLGSRALTVVSVLHDPSGEFVVLTCEDPTQGV